MAIFGRVGMDVLLVLLVSLVLLVLFVLLVLLVLDGLSLLFRQGLDVVCQGVGIAFGADLNSVEMEERMVIQFATSKAARLPLSFSAVPDEVLRRQTVKAEYGGSDEQLSFVQRKVFELRAGRHVVL